MWDAWIRVTRDSLADEFTTDVEAVVFTHDHTIAASNAAGSPCRPAVQVVVVTLFVPTHTAEVLAFVEYRRRAVVLKPRSALGVRDFVTVCLQPQQAGWDSREIQGCPLAD